MTKQLTPAQELRVLDKAATILAVLVMTTYTGDCPEPEEFNPEGKCKYVSVEKCAQCIREWAVNKVMKEMEESK